MANWQELKGKREAAARIGAEATKLVENAAKESRALTAEEDSKFQNLTRQYDKLNSEIRISDAGFARAGVGELLEHSINFSAVVQPEQRAEPEKEVRALKRDEKCESYLRSHEIELGERVSAGALIRAAIVGPKNEAERRALMNGSDSTGGFIMPTFAAAGVIDDLRASSAVLKAGCQTIPLVSDRTKYARVATEPGPAWRTESAAVTVEGSIFESVSFAPTTLVGVIKIGRETLEDAFCADESVEQTLTKSLALEIDRVALAGSGSGEPRGVINTLGIGSVSMATNGAALANYAKLLDCMYEVQSNNGNVNGVILHPRENVALAKLVDANDQPLNRPAMLSEIPFIPSTSLPINMTQGTANNASAIVVGDWSKLLIGVRTAVQFQILRERYSDTYEYGVLYSLRADVIVGRKSAFAKLIGCIPA